MKVWDLETGRVVATLEGHTREISGCAITLDNKHVVSASWDRTLKVWDIDSGNCLFTHRGDGEFNCVATSATAIVAGDDAGTVWVLDWPPSIRRDEAHRASSSGSNQHEITPTDAVSSSRSRAKKHTILFLAANPTGTIQLALDEETRAIRVALERSSYRNSFDLEIRLAARPRDLLDELRKLKPTVVHFSGHGGLHPVSTESTTPTPRRDVIPAASRTDSDAQYGLFFQGDDRRVQVLTAQTLRDTFSAAGSSVKLVVLNACYSDVQAEALLGYVDCVVGMSGSIGDDAARNFASAFYGGLGEHQSIAAAFHQGCVAIILEGLRDNDRPQLRIRYGVDAGKLVLGS